MKKLIFALLFFCLFTSGLSAQAVIMPKDLKISKMAEFLSGKGYKILEQNDTFLKLSDSQNASLFIDISDDKKSLLFNINILLKKNASKPNIDKLIDKINNLAMIKGTYNKEKQAIFFQYNFWIANGFTYETLEDAVLEFFLYQGDSYGLDDDKIISFQE